VETRTKRVSPNGDRKLWQEAMRDVRPLRDRKARDVPIRGSAPKFAPARGRTSRNAAPHLPPSLDRFAGIDRANAERLKRGLREIEARLDLHGMTQAEAYRALAVFIAASRAAGRRCVLVITGRGLGPNGPGVLRSSVPRWLELPELRQQVLAIAPAQPRHGGAGAIYLLLRRHRR
jgi:DNA-nicking Smr family endonuclease